MNKINIEEFRKINFRVAMVKSVHDDIKISCDNRDFIFNTELDVKENDKIIVIVEEDKLIIPVLDESIPIVPERDVEEGSKIR